MPNELIYQSEFSGQQMDERFRAVATLAEALTVLEQAIAAKYTKPADGIPSTDMDASVQSALALALTSVQSLADYYTKSEVDQLLAAINGMEYVDVAALPTASASTMGKIYLVGPDASGYYAYYYTSYDGSAYSWVGPLGTTQISLANYATKAELSQLDQELNGAEGSETEVEATGVAAQKLLKKDGSVVSASSPASIVKTFAGTPNAKYKITGRVGTTADTCLVVFYDSSDNVLSFSTVSTGTATPYQDVVVTAPENTSYFKVAGNTTQNYSAKAVLVVEAVDGIKDRVDALENAVFGETTEESLRPIRTATLTVLNATDGSDLASSGVNSVVCDYLVTGGLKYKVSGRVGTTANTCLAAFFNGDTFLASYQLTTGTATPYLNVELTAPANATRLRVAGNVANNYAPAAIEVGNGGLSKAARDDKKRLTILGAGLSTRTYAKTVGVFGGSVSVRDASETAKDIWKAVCGIAITNYGVGGAGFSSLQGTTPIPSQVDGAASKDIYILWASTNDFRNDRVCGTWQDYTAEDNYDESKLTTQCGGINYCIKKLYELNPKAEILFFTPMRFFTDESGYNPLSDSTNATGKTFAEYIEAMKECCSHYGIPVLDQFQIQGVSELNYADYYESDAVHPNAAAYAKIGYAQAAFILNES